MTSPQDTELGILRVYAFCQKIQQRASGQRESAAWATYLFVSIHPKSCGLFSLKVPATLFNGSRKGVVVA